MKKNFIKTVFLCTLVSFFVFTSCSPKDDEDPEARKITVYRGITLGSQNADVTSGNFLNTKTGVSVPLSQVTDKLQANLAMVFFTDYGVNNKYLTFPANMEDAATFKNELATNRLFSTNPGGIKYWTTSNLNSGTITKAYNGSTYMDASLFESVASSGSWDTFSSQYEEYNKSGSLNYTLDPKSGNVFSVTINGTVRALLYVKVCNAQSILFDLIIESRAKYSKVENAARIMPEL